MDIGLGIALWKTILCKAYVIISPKSQLELNCVDDKIDECFVCEWVSEWMRGS